MYYVLFLMYIRLLHLNYLNNIKYNLFTLLTINQYFIIFCGLVQAENLLYLSNK